MNRIIILFAFFFSLIAPTFSWAQSEPDDAPNKDQSILTMGVLFEAGTNALIGKERLFPMPFIYYQNKYVTYATNSLMIHPVETGPFQLSAIGAFRVSDIEMSSDDRFDDFERDFAFEAGGHAEYRYRNFSVYGQYLTDVTNAHEGDEITIGVIARKMIDRVHLSLNSGVRYRSSELVNYLYGTTGQKGAPLFPVVELDSGWFGFARLTASIHLKDNWSLLLTAAGENLSESVVLSPVVDKEYTLRGGIGITYTF
ncbi:MipA/OmpV family protein [Pseudemcibacter aquimaris]|uniref:MipA/OmpV family protein n=1 Tax=Pseudemcibacter aquimaris TaxID=2857064 RepID=UPI0020111310|nr:MipA/OmpV family protein [Pseudemcibacter aquimaris]MCC3860397.1 MipA/OmpV family protein [Pseudemcibacter aquimaris]WDU57723.1 MipA/OmpV family protein [Pseudemcibacter aquimaris]